VSEFTEAAFSPAVPALLAAAERFALDERLPEARAAYLAAVAGDSSGAARHAFGCFLARIEFYDEAAEQLSAAIATATRSGNDRLLAAACNNLAAVERQRGRNEPAARWQQRSIAARHRAGSHSADDAACDLANIANDAILSGRFDLADRLLRGSLSIEAARGSLEGQAADWGSMGVVAALRGEFGRATVCLGRALRLHCRLDDARGAARDLMNLAWLCGLRGRWRSAVRCLDAAVRRLEGVHAPELTARARRLLAEARAIDAVARRDPLRN
jgi:tetratricopeptide (TPR) repeat protein